VEVWLKWDVGDHWQPKGTSFIRLTPRNADGIHELRIYGEALSDAQLEASYAGQDP